MGSRRIERLRKEYPGDSDTEIAQALAQKEGYIAIVRYKNSASAPDYTDFGACRMEEEIQGYLNSPYCHDAEVVYDGRPGALQTTEELILNGTCSACGEPASKGLSYICGRCASMFCDSCYARLPLTGGDRGYGMCPSCRVEVHRAIPGFYGKQSGSRAPSVGDRELEASRPDEDTMSGPRAPDNVPAADDIGDRPAAWSARRKWWQFWKS